MPTMFLSPGEGDPEPEDQDDESADAVESAPAPRWTTAKVVVLVAAMSFLGGSIGYFLASIPNRPSEDSVDVGFLRDMSAHHGTAITLALAAAEFAQDDAVRRYARDVVVWQRYESGVMDRLVSEWGYELHDDPSDVAMAWMGMRTTVTAMPGMPTAEELRQSSQARGTEADRVFLELMIRHHEGGVHMAEAARERATTRTVRAMAERMAEEQTDEIGRYRGAQQRLGFPVTSTTVTGQS